MTQWGGRAVRRNSQNIKQEGGYLGGRDQTTAGKANEERQSDNPPAGQGLKFH